jgi:hypothetical protein
MNQPVVQLLKDFLLVTEPEVSLLYSQQPSTGPCPESDFDHKTSPHNAYRLPVFFISVYFM